MPRQVDVLPQLGPVLHTEAGEVGRLDEEGGQAALEGPRHPGGGADALGVGGGGGEADEDVLVGAVAALLGQPHPLGQPVDAVGAAAQGDLPQGRQVFLVKKVDQRPLGLLLPVDLSRLQPLHQLLRLDVHQLHLVGAVEHPVGDALSHRHPGDGRHRVVEALDVLHIDGGVDVDARPQQFVHVLIALLVAAAVGVGVGQFVHQHQLGAAGDGRVQIEFPQGDAPMLHRQGGQSFQPL